MASKKLTVALALSVSMIPTVAHAQDNFFQDGADTGLDVTWMPISQGALHIGAKYWQQRGFYLNCTYLKITVAPTPPDGGMWAEPSVCNIVVNSASWPIYRESHRQYCVGITHEMGHILGFSHNDDPKSVMYAGEEYSSPLVKVPGCINMPDPQTPTNRRLGCTSVKQLTVRTATSKKATTTRYISSCRRWGK